MSAATSAVVCGAHAFSRRLVLDKTDCVGHLEVAKMGTGRVFRRRPTRDEQTCSSDVDGLHPPRHGLGERVRAGECGGDGAVIGRRPAWRLRPRPVRAVTSALTESAGAPAETWRCWPHVPVAQTAQRRRREILHQRWIQRLVSYSLSSRGSAGATSRPGMDTSGDRAPATKCVRGLMTVSIRSE